MLENPSKGVCRDADAVVRHGAGDPGHEGAVPVVVLGVVVVVDEIPARTDLASEVRVIGIDARVQHGDVEVIAGGDVPGFRTVHVGVGEDHDLVIAKLLNIKIIFSNSGAQRSNNLFDFLT